MNKKTVRKNVCIAVVAVMVITLCVIHYAVSQVSKKEAEERYQQIYDTFLSCVPVEGQNHLNVFFCREEEQDYLYLRIESKVILGMRDHDSGDVYYFADGACYDQDGKVRETDISGDQISEKLNQVLRTYLADENVTYSFDTPDDPALPLGVYPLDTGYYLISRSEDHKCVEAISYCTDDNNQHVRWTVTQMDGDITFYAVVAKKNICNPDGMPGWGSIPQCIVGNE